MSNKINTIEECMASVLLNTNRLNECAMQINLDLSVKAHVFVWQSPHCECVSVWLYKNGWSSQADPDIKRDLYYFNYCKNSKEKITKSDFKKASEYAEQVNRLIAELKKEVYG